MFNSLSLHNPTIRLRGARRGGASTRLRFAFLEHDRILALTACLTGATGSLQVG